MSGRNWTRRSIEELVEAYLRGKKRPSSGGDSYCVYDTDLFNISANDPFSGGDISVGYLNNTYESINNSLYYPALSGAPADYIDAAYPTYGQTRATQYSGSKSLEGCGSITGRIIKSGDVNTERPFTILTVPKTCDLTALKKAIIRVGGGQAFGTGHIAIVTSDFTNNGQSWSNSDNRIKRTIYLPETSGGSLAYFDGSGTTVGWTLSTSRAKFVPRSGTEYYITNDDDTVRYTKSGTYIYQSTYPMYHNFGISGEAYIGTFTPPSANTSKLAQFFTSVKSAYDGTIEFGYNGIPTVKNLNFLTFIILGEGSGSDYRSEVEKMFFYLARLFVDNNFSNYKFYNDTKPQPRFISGEPEYGTDIPAFIYGSISTSHVVQYNKQSVTIT